MGAPLNSRVATFARDVDTIHAVTHGDMNTVVQTDGGPVRSVAKLIADNQDAIDNAQSLALRELGSADDGKGSGLVTYVPPEKRTIAFSVKKALDETVDLRTKFGLTGDINDDQTNAWNDLIAYINSLPSWGGALKIKGCYRITGARPALVNGIAMVGDGISRSRLFFDNTDGLTFDFSTKQSQGIGVVLRDLALTTNRNDKVAIFTRAPSGGAYYQRLAAERVFLASETRWQGLDNSTVTDEWAIGCDFGVLGAGTKYSEISLDDIVIYGSTKNVSYATRTNSIPIRSNDVTGLRINRPKIIYGGDAIQQNGQSEGLILYGGTIVATNRGVVIDKFVNPANNQCISDTHISPYTRGIVITDSGTSYQSSMNKFSNIFILEREDVLKPDGFIGVESYAAESEFNQVQVWANGNAAGTIKTGFRMGYRNQNLNNCSAHNMNYVLGIRDYAQGNTAAGMIRLTRLRENQTKNGFREPGSTRFPTGDYSGEMAGNARVQGYCGSQQTYNQTDGLEFIDEWPSTRRNSYNPNTFYTWDIKTTPGGASGYDHRTYFSSGDSAAGTNGRGSRIMYGSSIYFNADVYGPYVDNVTTCGMPGRRNKDVYSAAGTINTSDARLKTSITAFNAAELAAACELAGNLGWYKWLASVDEKGDDARKHCGTTVQDAIAIFESHGLDPMEYGAICHDEIPAEDELKDTDVDGNTFVVREARAASDIYSFRWTELLVFIVAGMNFKVASLEQRIAAVEERIAT